MKIIKAGFWQELHPDGSVTDSFMRFLETLFFIFLCAYTFFSFIYYESHFQEYTKLLTQNCITEQSYNMLISQLKIIDWDIFMILVIATVVPKAIQKFAEMKTGIKDSSETTETTTKTEKSITQPS